jgi:hypothetical protein
MACAKLSIDNLENFEDSLDKFEKVIRLLPQMEIFIREVDQIVSNFQNKFIPSNDLKNKSSSSKLNQLLLVIGSWSKSMEEYSDLKVKFIILKSSPLGTAYMYFLKSLNHREVRMFVLVNWKTFLDLLNRKRMLQR